MQYILLPSILIWPPSCCRRAHVFKDVGLVRLALVSTPRGNGDRRVTRFPPEECKNFFCWLLFAWKRFSMSLRVVQTWKMKSFFCNSRVYQRSTFTLFINWFIHEKSTFMYFSIPKNYFFTWVCTSWVWQGPHLPGFLWTELNISFEPNSDQSNGSSRIGSRWPGTRPNTFLRRRNRN